MCRNICMIYNMGEMNSHLGIPSNVNLTTPKTVRKEFQVIEKDGEFGVQFNFEEVEKCDQTEINKNEQKKKQKNGTLFSICKNKIEKLPFNLVVNSVCCGKEHVLCLTVDGKIYSYGLGSRGQLGHGTTENEETPRVVEALEGIPIKMIATGGWHSVALSTIGDIYVWGWNESGQLGLPASISNKKLSEVVTFQAIPQLLDFPHDAIIKTVSCGSRHTAAISEDGQLWTWGWNGHNQLGLNKLTPVDYPNCVQIPPEYKVQNVICNYWNTIVVV
ncbi:RCC1 domain-containing protein 1-like isoform X2 [Centruroides sculpturatus]|uniref:RCC1 domain-containing protein 1-like isoform X2 n=1 Tax=Centruroides sculpturatus TaxID=218467 RepID=UPI000C6EC555|nr:RCC1 domain-containing protein 1-like isoform X2 [Centruroides sculpturatus]XP_023239740.1 RCC1 domain-containing protein 1-like isoform X2 [Centruroides sculpturatus]